jgi:cell division septation protein DedD
MFLVKLRPTLIVATLILVTAHRLLAPIQERPESPTPAPEQSAKPTPKRAASREVPKENSKRLEKRENPSPETKTQVDPQRNLFDGTWRGFLNVADYTFVR